MTKESWDRLLSFKYNTYLVKKGAVGKVDVVEADNS